MKPITLFCIMLLCIGAGCAHRGFQIYECPDKNIECETRRFISSPVMIDNLPNHEMARIHFEYRQSGVKKEWLLVNVYSAERAQPYAEHLILVVDDHPYKLPATVLSYNPVDYHIDNKSTKITGFLATEKIFNRLMHAKEARLIFGDHDNERACMLTPDIRRKFGLFYRYVKRNNETPGILLRR